MINNVLGKDKIMRRTNLVKTILCGLIGTIAMGTAVFAGTVSREGYVRGKTTLILTAEHWASMLPVVKQIQQQPVHRIQVEAVNGSLYRCMNIT